MFPSADTPETPDPRLEARVRRAMTGPDPVLEDPPADLWAGIASELGLSADAPTSGAAAPPSGQSSGITRRALFAGLAAAFVAGGLAGVGITWLAGHDEEPTQVETEVQLAPLEELDDVQGRARLLREGSALFLDIELDADIANPDGYVEVWLINEDLTRMITVGTFPPGRHVRLQVDPELVDQRYTIVDLSNEPYDDNPAHSGDTVLRSTQTL